MSEALIFFATLLSILLVLLTLPGTLELALLTIGGLLPARRSHGKQRDLPRLAIVVPAHNEAEQIAQCISSLKACPHSAPAHIIVVADNCTDHTAELARRAGARVLERTDLHKRGKGYALDFAFTTLANEPYDAFAVVDADSCVDANFIDTIQREFATGAEAVQVHYGVGNAEAGMRTRLMRLALLAFNGLRPRGRQRWGLSAGIYGNGFALSRRALEQVPYKASSIVEDLEYHLHLVRAGLRVHFCPQTSVWGDMPVHGQGVKTQRARWEGGRLRMLNEVGPHLLSAVRTGQWRLLEPLFDLLLLPLAMHVLLLIAALILPFSWAALYAGIALTIVALHVIVAVFTGGGGLRDLLPLAVVPFYIVWKALQIPRLLLSAGKNTTWVRTERVS